MRFVSFTSGSCGNCCWIGPDRREDGPGVLIDAGASMRAVKREMFARGLSLDDIGAILVTHDHLDHIRFLGTFCKYRSPQVCAPAKLHRALSAHPFTKDHIASCRRVLKDSEEEVCGMTVRWFEVPHDATQTVGYALQDREGHLLVMMTDLEHVTPEGLELAAKADTLIIESNYDTDMLLSGPYPPELQRRILDEGHLSNDACADALRRIWHQGLKNIFLCHLSGNNNTPEKAYKNALQALGEIGVQQGEVNLRTLQRGVAGPLLQL